MGGVHEHGGGAQEQRGLKHWLKTVRPSANASVIKEAADHLESRLAPFEAAAAAASSVAETVPLSPPADGFDDGRLAALEVLSKQLTWLDGERTEFSTKVPGIISEAVGQKIQRLCERARALLRQHVESSSLRAALELCRRATGQEATEPIDNSLAEDLIRGFEQCSSMRVQEPGHVMAMVAVAQACFKSDIDHDLAVRAATAVLRVIDTASSSASQPAVSIAKSSLDAACSGGALALARAKHDDASSQGHSHAADGRAGTFARGAGAGPGR